LEALRGDRVRLGFNLGPNQQGSGIGHILKAPFQLFRDTFQWPCSLWPRALGRT
jgi:hypothetical protein